jgi:hypothetical protein
MFAHFGLLVIGAEVRRSWARSNARYERGMSDVCFSFPRSGVMVVRHYKVE